jgi:hypothetical protein
MKYLIQHLKAPNDKNGNPQRCYVVYSTQGEFISTHNEGYKGKACIPEYIRKYNGNNAFDLPSINVTVKEYKSWLKYKGEV